MAGKEEVLKEVMNIRKGLKRKVNYSLAVTDLIAGWHKCNQWNYLSLGRTN